MRISDWSSDVCSSDLPDLQVVHPDGAVAAIKALAWQGNTLYARAAIWNHADEGEAGTTVVYAGTMESSRRLDKLPGDIDALLDEAGLSDAVGQDEVPDRKSTRLNSSH